MRKETIKSYKAINRIENPIPSPKIMKTKKDYDRKKFKNILRELTKS